MPKTRKGQRSFVWLGGGRGALTYTERAEVRHASRRERTCDCFASRCHCFAVYTFGRAETNAMRTNHSELTHDCLKKNSTRQLHIHGNVTIFSISPSPHLSLSLFLWLVPSTWRKIMHKTMILLWLSDVFETLFPSIVAVISEFIVTFILCEICWNWKNIFFTVFWF